MTERLKNNLRKQDFSQTGTYWSLLQKFLLLEEISPIIQFPAPLSLRRRVLERDGWRCQICGSSADLQVHHQQFRSKLGDDALDNLISLCARCHRQQHGHEQ